MIGFGLILLTSVFVLVMLTSVFVDVLTLIWFILMLKYISKIQLKMGSIIEWDVVIYISDVYRVSKIYSIVEVNLVESWWICGRRSDII